MKKLTDKEIQDLLEKRIFNAEPADQPHTAQHELSVDTFSTDAVKNAGDSSHSESLLATANTSDMETYGLLFDLLQKEPETIIPMSFARQVTKQLATENTKSNDFRFYLLISLISLSGLGVAYYSLSLLDQKTAALFIETLLNYKWLCLFTLSIPFLVQLTFQKMELKMERPE